MSRVTAVRMKVGMTGAHGASFSRALFLALVLLAGCCAPAFARQDGQRGLDGIAEDYVRLGLQLQNHDKNAYMYLGPQQWRTEARENPETLSDITAELLELYFDLHALPQPDTMLLQQRKSALDQRLVAMITRARILQGQFPAGFDEETRLMFGVVVPQLDEQHFISLAQELDELIPGEGELSERMEAFRERYVIPPDRLTDVMTAAIDECRKRTRERLDLPAGEEVSLNITRNQPWVGFTEYKGNSKSIIHINQDVPVHAERAVELGCHEAYPGHHVHASLMQSVLAEQRGWMEFTFSGLYGPLTLMAEGLANYGVDIAFSRQERMEFDKAVIYPLAGIDAAGIETYYRFIDLLDQLNYARNETARRYLYGGMSRADAQQWLMDYGLETEGTAAQRMDFIDAYRAYVVNYNFGKDSIRRYIEQAAGADHVARWEIFRILLTSPLLPVGPEQLD